MNTTSRKKAQVLVGGCFDVLHEGHIQFLEKAAILGNYLLIALESDENVSRRKGSSRPIHTQQQRAHMLMALRVVDEVLLLPTMNTDSEYSDLVTNIAPNFIAITEGDPYQDHKERQAKSIGAKLVVIPKTPTLSTSQLAKLIGLE